MKEQRRMVGFMLIIFFLLCVVMVLVVKDVSGISKGKRFTYCDGLRHLTIDHGMEIDLTECEKKEKTDLQIRVNR